MFMSPWRSLSSIDLEQLLVGVDAIKANDHRLPRSNNIVDTSTETGIRSSARHVDDDDDDWD